MELVQNTTALTEEGYISRADSARLRYSKTSFTKNPEAYLVFVNGRSEWIEKYPQLFNELQLPPHISCLTFDHRGQGRSDGRRGTIDSYETYADDSKAVIDHVVGDLPYAVLSHSMGGLITLYSIMTGRISPKSVVLSAPLLQLRNRPVPRLIANPLSSLLVKMGLSNIASGAGRYDTCRFARNRLTHSRDHYSRVVATPYPCPSASFGWVQATFLAIEAIFQKELLRSYETPTLILGASEEKVVDNSGLSEWIKQAGQCSPAPIQFQMIQGARHELLGEIPTYRDQALKATKAWIAKY